MFDMIKRSFIAQQIRWKVTVVGVYIQLMLDSCFVFVFFVVAFLSVK